MKQKILRLLRYKHTVPLPPILRELLKDEAIGGKLILGAAILALLAANSSVRGVYEGSWSQILSVSVSHFHISLDLRHWITEGLMAIFFLVVGLEIKREAVQGQLREFRTALLPIGAAIGGMIVPAVIYLVINADNPDASRGWAIPIATDIAFVLAIMSLLGDRISSSLKLFLLTLAIVDDIGSILVIALFYGSGISLLPLMVAGGLTVLIIVVSKFHRLTMPLFVAFALLFWVAIFESGIHASIAGAIIGFLAPVKARYGTSIAEQLEAKMIPVSTFIVAPLFAFASFGIVLNKNPFSGQTPLPLFWGIIIGFVFGKVLGISIASWLLVKLKLADLPESTNWFQLVGVGLLAGVGFTVSVFIADIAFDTDLLLLQLAKVSILIASVISGVSGYLFLRHRKLVEKTLTQEI